MTNQRDHRRPGMTSGPSQPVQEQGNRNPFGRGATPGREVGQWLDDAAAEQLIADHLGQLKNGARTFDLPKGMGRSSTLMVRSRRQPEFGLFQVRVV